MGRSHLLNYFCLQRLALPIDIFHNKCYIVDNIPARPLPQGMLNYGGFFIWGAG